MWTKEQLDNAKIEFFKDLFDSIDKSIERKDGLAWGVTVALEELDECLHFRMIEIAVEWRKARLASINKKRPKLKLVSSEEIETGLR
jgi:hypothetical protein